MRAWHCSQSIPGNGLRQIATVNDRISILVSISECRRTIVFTTLLGFRRRGKASELVHAGTAHSVFTCSPGVIFKLDESHDSAFSVIIVHEALVVRGNVVGHSFSCCLWDHAVGEQALGPPRKQDGLLLWPGKQGSFAEMASTFKSDFICICRVILSVFVCKHPKYQRNVKVGTRYRGLIWMQSRLKQTTNVPKISCLKQYYESKV